MPNTDIEELRDYNAYILWQLTHLLRTLKVIDTLTPNQKNVVEAKSQLMAETIKQDLQQKVIEARIDEQHWLHLNGNYTFIDCSMMGGDMEDYKITITKESRENRISELQAQLNHNKKGKL